MVPSLIETLQIAQSKGGSTSTFFNFVNLLRKASTPITGFTMSELYRVSKYWQSQGQFLRGYANDVIMDPRLSQVVVEKSSNLDLTRIYGYVYEISYTDPNTGKPEVLYRTLNSERPLSAGEAASDLMELIELHGDRYAQLLNEGGELPEDMTFTLRRMLHYQYTR